MTEEEDRKGDKNHHGNSITNERHMHENTMPRATASD